jgi:DNA-binding MarR family transcriptional regulator
VARLTFRAFALSLEQRITNHRVTIGQWRFLRELWREDGVTQRELSDRLSMREPSTAAAVRSLEGAGLVRRVRDDCDRRKIRIYLTPQARRLREPLPGHVRDVNATATAGVPKKDLETTRRVLLQLMAHLNAAGANRLLVDEEEASAQSNGQVMVPSGP